MGTVALRVFLYSVLPVVLALGHLGLDKSARGRERSAEIFLLYLFGVGVAGSGIGGFFGHFFLSDSIAESIGWPTGNPFQLEVAFANLAIGILGIVAMGRRDGFREATVIAVTVFGIGAAIVHAGDIIASGNLAPGNTVQNVGNLLKPALLIGFLAAARRAERSSGSAGPASADETWRGPRVKTAGLLAAGVSAGYSAGFAFGWPLVGTLVGTLLAAGLAASVIARSPGQARRTDPARGPQVQAASEGASRSAD